VNSSAQGNLATESANSVAITSVLTQSYRVASPLLLGENFYGQIATAFNPTTNQTEVFYIADASGGDTEQTDFHVYLVTADPNSDTGWSSIDLGFPGKAARILAGTYPDGSRIIYVGDNATIYSKRGGQDWNQPWHTYPSPPSLGPDQKIDQIWPLAMVYDHANNPVATFSINTNGFTEGWFARLDGDTWSTLPEPLEYPNSEWPGFIATADGAGAVGVYRSAGPYDQRTLIAYVGGASTPPSIAGEFAPRACVRSQSGFDDVIVTDDDVVATNPSNKAWYMRWTLRRAASRQRRSRP
jgi:hypothetical protein